MKTRFLRMSALVLACAFLLLTSAACASGTGKPLLKLEKDGISVSISQNVYELMLSRMKGSLVFYGYKSPSGATPAEDDYWDYYDKFNKTDLQTADEFYKDAVLDSCRTYLIALYLFEKEGLSLSAKKLRDTVRQPLSAANLHQCAHKNPHHIVEEAVSGDSDV